MTLPRRRRRRIDLFLGALIAVIAIVASLAVYLGSDVRATTLHTAASGVTPASPTARLTSPQAVQQVWQRATDPRYGAVATPYGSVVTASEHGVEGFDAISGAPLWSYTRSNVDLCALGSGDTVADNLDSWTGVHGVVTLFSKNGYCSAVTLSNPKTGERLYQRTSPNQDPGQLFFGNPYAGWMGRDYLELWRHDLVATIRYGNQPNPVNSTGPHVGCTFTDAAVIADQLATIEHCGDETNLVLNWPTPSDAPDKGDQGWDANHSTPKATISLHSGTALILAVTADRAAVLVSDPTPAIVVYDASGTEISRVAVAVDGSAIQATAAAGITPSVTYQSRRYTIVGSTLFAFSSQSISIPAPPPDSDTADSDAPDSDAADSEAADSDAAGDDADAAEPGPTTVDVDTPIFEWMVSAALGLPAHIGSDIVIPVAAGLQVTKLTSGEALRTIAVDRGGYAGRVDVRAVGEMLIETRGDAVVGLASVSG